MGSLIVVLLVFPLRILGSLRHQGGYRRFSTGISGLTDIRPTTER